MNCSGLGDSGSGRQGTQRKGPIRKKFTEEIKNPEESGQEPKDTRKRARKNTNEVSNSEQSPQKFRSVLSSLKISKKTARKIVPKKNKKNNKDKNPNDASIDFPPFTASDKENIEPACPETPKLRSSQRNKPVDDGINTPGASLILNKIRHGYRARISAKKQKLDDYFKDIRELPGKIGKYMDKTTFERQAKINVMKDNISAVIERLEKVHELQTINQQKLDIMVKSFQKSHTQVSGVVKQVVVGLQHILEDYSQSMEMIEKQQEDITADYIEQCQNQLCSLHQKILAESQDEDKRRLCDLGGML